MANAFDSLDALGFGGEDLGSNSWVVAGSRTVSGRPILANDPHLGLRTPSVWYLAAIEAPGYMATGATLPGIPGVIIGHNNRIAWGLTSIEPDVQDLFVEEVDPKDPSRYRHRGEWKSFSVRRETIRVRGARDTELLVRGSVHGPVVTGVFDGAETLGKAVSLRWTGLDDGDRTAESFFAIGTARNWDEFLAAAALLRTPPQNLIYADVEGHIGYAAAGAMPIRPRADGLLPVSGEGDDDWAGMIPFASLPRVLDPPAGFVVTANNRLVAGEAGLAFGLNWAEPYRARRIRELLESKPRLTAADVQALQLDRKSGQAEELLPLLLDTAPLDAASRRRAGEASRLEPRDGAGVRPRGDLRRLVRRAREDAGGRARADAARADAGTISHPGAGRQLQVVRRRADVPGRDLRRLQGRDASGRRGLSRAAPGSGPCALALAEACTRPSFPTTCSARCGGCAGCSISRSGRGATARRSTSARSARMAPSP